MAEAQGENRDPTRSGGLGAFWTWIPFLVSCFLLGNELSGLARRAGVPLRGGDAGLLLGLALFWSVCSAGYLLWLPLSWARPGLSRRMVVRCFAAPLGWGLLLLFPLLTAFGPIPAAACALLAGSVGSAWLLLTLVGRLGPGLVVVSAAGLGLLAFTAPAWLLDAFGPWLAAPALLGALLSGGALLSVAGRPLARFPERFGPALLAAALPLAAGSLYHGLLRPTLLFRRHCLSPQAILGLDREGGAFLRNRTGEVFYGSSKTPGLSRLGLPRDARLGRIRSSSSEAAALELRPSGDCLWFVRRGAGGFGPPRRVAIGSMDREAFFVADFDIEGEHVVAVDALGPRVAWIDGQGRIVKVVFPPPEEGTPQLISIRDKLRLWTASGRILTLEGSGSWSVLKPGLPPGESVDFVASGHGHLLLVRTAKSTTEIFRLDEKSRIWVATGHRGASQRTAADSQGRTYSLEGSVVNVRRLGSPPQEPAARIGPSADVVRAFLRSPAGLLIGRLQ